MGFKDGLPYYDASAGVRYAPSGKISNSVYMFPRGCKAREIPKKGGSRPFSFLYLRITKPSILATSFFGPSLPPFLTAGESAESPMRKMAKAQFVQAAPLNAPAESSGWTKSRQLVRAAPNSRKLRAIVAFREASGRNGWYINVRLYFEAKGRSVSAGGLCRWKRRGRTFAS